MTLETIKLALDVVSVWMLGMGEPQIVKTVKPCQSVKAADCRVIVYVSEITVVTPDPVK